MFEGPPGKLTRIGLPQPNIGQRTDNAQNDSSATVEVKFHDIFTREAVRPLKIDDQRLIKNISARVGKAPD